MSERSNLDVISKFEVDAFRGMYPSTVLGGRIGFEEGRKTTIYKIETRGPNMIVRVKAIRHGPLTSERASLRRNE
jgi:hypothetical protein